MTFQFLINIISNSFFAESSFTKLFIFIDFHWKTNVESSFIFYEICYKFYKLKHFLGLG